MVRLIQFKSEDIIPGDAGLCHLKQSPDYIANEVDSKVMKPLDELEPNHMPIFEINHAYVPLSCVCRLQDLTILQPFDRTILKA